jgi:hypothetical protein
MACNGSADDGWTPERIESVCLYLELRLNRWFLSADHKRRMFDESVRVLIVATLAEVAGARERPKVIP